MFCKEPRCLKLGQCSDYFKQWYHSHHCLLPLMWTTLGLVTALNGNGKHVFKNAVIVLPTISHVWVAMKTVHIQATSSVCTLLPYNPQTLTAHLYQSLLLDAEKSQIRALSCAPPHLQHVSCAFTQVYADT